MMSIAYEKIKFLVLSFSPTVDSRSMIKSRNCSVDNINV